MRRSTYVDLVHGFLSVLARVKMLLHVLKLVGRLPTCPYFSGTVLVYTSYLRIIIYSVRFTLCFCLEKVLNGHPGPFLLQSLLSFHCWKPSPNSNTQVDFKCIKFPYCSSKTKQNITLKSFQQHFFTSKFCMYFTNKAHDVHWFLLSTVNIVVLPFPLSRISFWRYAYLLFTKSVKQQKLFT